MVSMRDTPHHFAPLTDEEIEAAVKAYQENGENKAAAARALNLPETSFKRRIKAAALRGLLGTKPVLPGFWISKTSITRDDAGNVKSETVQQKPGDGDQAFEIPTGRVLGKITSHVRGGIVTQEWVRTHPGEINWVEVFKEAFKEYEGRALPVPAPDFSGSDFLNLFISNDWHINMLAWEREVGENWDLKIAERVIGSAMDRCITRTGGAHIGIVLGGGDLMHNDDNTNRTAKSHNVLDADGRHAKGIEVAQRLKVRMIDRVLENHDEVIVRILQGNHDEQSSVAIAHFLKAWYRNEPRVFVDTDQSLFWYYEFGLNMLAATHGHTVKLSEMPRIMAHRRAEMWGRTKFRYAHGFHVHHKEKIATEGEGVVCESHQAPIPQDGWHYGSGYLSGRSVKSITYHKDLGLWTETREPILDGIGSDPKFKQRVAA
jgi:hypothetical protein